ncbi:hypothetical protein IT407_02645 [Candidatus Uhrbacteria bacterium]|nr:hypothetical protein [Candidatus Uhrbacteria bacterium]
MKKENIVLIVFSLSLLLYVTVSLFMGYAYVFSDFSKTCKSIPLGIDELELRRIMSKYAKEDAFEYIEDKILARTYNRETSFVTIIEKKYSMQDNWRCIALFDKGKVVEVVPDFE